MKSILNEPIHARVVKLIFCVEPVINRDKWNLIGNAEFTDRIPTAKQRDWNVLTVVAAKLLSNLIAGRNLAIAVDLIRSWNMAYVLAFGQAGAVDQSC